MATNLKALCAQYNINFKKGLGQNLLLDANINNIMIDAAALSKEDAVIEVGAGLGALTEHLAARAGEVLAVEIDRAFMPCLEDRFGDMPHVRLFRGDILNHELDKLIAEHLTPRPKYKMMGNLPYYITTPILFEFLEAPVFFERMVIMVQEEVGLRMVARVNAEDYGVLSIAARLYADVDLVHRVPRTCFTPQPKVDSAIVRLRCVETPRSGDLPPVQVMRVVRAGFSQRRKTLRNSLIKSGQLGLPAEAVEAALAAAGVDPGRRPQTVALEEWIAIAQALPALPEAEEFAP